MRPPTYLPGFDGALHDSACTDLDSFRLLYATALSARLYGVEPLPGTRPRGTINK